jgi:hypothetical protein
LYNFNQNNFYKSLETEFLLKEKKLFLNNTQYLYKYLKDLKCRNILVEKKYTDKNYLIDYTKYYARCFTDYPKKCNRVHFFDKNYSEENFLALINNEENSSLSHEDFNNSYIGFIVVRPLPETIIGKTVLRTYDRNNKGYCFQFVRNYDVNLFGLPLKIEKSLAFQEQDTVTAACATSALWSAFNKTHELFEKGQPPSPSEITDFALEYIYGSRPITSKGLSLDQMCQAIHKVGLEPHVTNVERGDSIVPILSHIYSYVKGQIPIVLVINPENGAGLHAITISGYFINNKPIVRRETDKTSEKKYCRLRGLRVSEFFVHDDQLGPFVKMNITRGTKNCPIHFDIPIPWGSKSFWGRIVPVAIIVPLYPKIRVGFLSVYESITKLNAFIELSCLLQKKSLEWDIYFSRLNQFKINIRDNKQKYQSRYSDIIFRKYPKFLWRCAAYLNGNEILEVIADATDTHKSFFLKEMIVFDNQVKSNMKNFLRIPGIRPFVKRVYTEQFVSFIENAVR